MRKILVELSKKCFSTEADQQKLQRYHAFQKEDGWNIHVEYLRLMQGMMIEEMFSTRFTSLPPDEKDIQQRAMKHVFDVIEFLVDPTKYGRINLKIKEHNQKMEATIGKRPERSTK